MSRGAPALWRLGCFGVRTAPCFNAPLRCHNGRPQEPSQEPAGMQHLIVTTVGSASPWPACRKFKQRGCWEAAEARQAPETAARPWFMCTQPVRTCSVHKRQQRVAHDTQSMSLTLGAAVTYGYVMCIKAAREACTAACGRAGAWWLIS